MLVKESPQNSGIKMQQQEVIDISGVKVSDDTLKEIRRYEDRIFFEPRCQLYRLNREQAVRMVDLGMVVSLGNPANQSTMRNQVAGVFDTYSSIPAGAYYSSTLAVPEMTKEVLEAKSTRGTPMDWISRKKYDGFVVDGLEFYFHQSLSNGGALNTVDRCVEVSWGRNFSDGMGITPKKRLTCFQDSMVINEKRLKEYLTAGFNLLDRGVTHPSQSRYCGSELGAFPLTSFRKIASGEELMAFFERFLGFAEEMVPYSEEAYQLQTFPGWHDAITWSNERILQEIENRQATRKQREELLRACGQL